MSGSGDGDGASGAARGVHPIMGGPLRPAARQQRAGVYGPHASAHAIPGLVPFHVASSPTTPATGEVTTLASGTLGSIDGRREMPGTASGHAPAATAVAASAASHPPNLSGADSWRLLPPLLSPDEPVRRTPGVSPLTLTLPPLHTMLRGMGGGRGGGARAAQQTSDHLPFPVGGELRPPVRASKRQRMSLPVDRRGEGAATEAAAGKTAAGGPAASGATARGAAVVADHWPFARHRAIPPPLSLLPARDHGSPSGGGSSSTGGLQSTAAGPTRMASMPCTSTAMLSVAQGYADRNYGGVGGGRGGGGGSGDGGGSGARGGNGQVHGRPGATAAGGADKVHVTHHFHVCGHVNITTTPGSTVRIAGLGAGDTFTRMGAAPPEERGHGEAGTSPPLSPPPRRSSRSEETLPWKPRAGTAEPTGASADGGSNRRGEVARSPRPPLGASPPAAERRDGQRRAAFMASVLPVRQGPFRPAAPPVRQPPRPPPPPPHRHARSPRDGEPQGLPPLHSLLLHRPRSSKPASNTETFSTGGSQQPREDTAAPVPAATLSMATAAAGSGAATGRRGGLDDSASSLPAKNTSDGGGGRASAASDGGPSSGLLATTSTSSWERHDGRRVAPDVCGRQTTRDPRLPYARQTMRGNGGGIGHHAKMVPGRPVTYPGQPLPLLQSKRPRPNHRQGDNGNVPPGGRGRGFTLLSELPSTALGASAENYGWPSRTDPAVAAMPSSPRRRPRSRIEEAASKVTHPPPPATPTGFTPLPLTPLLPMASLPPLGVAAALTTAASIGCQQGGGGRRVLPVGGGRGRYSSPSASPGSASGGPLLPPPRGPPPTAFNPTGLAGDRRSSPPHPWERGGRHGVGGGGVGSGGGEAWRSTCGSAPSVGASDGQATSTTGGGLGAGAGGSRVRGGGVSSGLVMSGAAGSGGGGSGGAVAPPGLDLSDWENVVSLYVECHSARDGRPVADWVKPPDTRGIGSGAGIAAMGGGRSTSGGSGGRSGGGGQSSGLGVGGGTPGVGHGARPGVGGGGSGTASISCYSDVTGGGSGVGGGVGGSGGGSGGQHSAAVVAAAAATSSGGDDRKRVEKWRTTGRTFELLGRPLFEEAIGYKRDVDGRRTKQKIYLVVARCRVVSEMRRKKEAIPVNAAELTALIDRRLEEKRLERDRARHEREGGGSGVGGGGEGEGGRTGGAGGAAGAGGASGGGGGEEGGQGQQSGLRRQELPERPGRLGRLEWQAKIEAHRVVAGEGVKGMARKGKVGRWRAERVPRLPQDDLRWVGGSIHELGGRWRVVSSPGFTGGPDRFHSCRLCSGTERKGMYPTPHTRAVQTP